MYQLNYNTSSFVGYLLNCETSHSVSDIYMHLQLAYYGYVRKFHITSCTNLRTYTFSLITRHLLCFHKVAGIYEV